VKRPQRPEPRAVIGQPPPQRSSEHLPDAFPVRERDRYASHALAYVILLNGFAALILVTALAFAPQSASDPRRLTWAMLVFGSGALAGLLSSLFAYISRTEMASSHLVMQDLLRVGAIIAAVGSGAAFLTALNIMALMVPETSTTRPKSKPQEQTPAPTAPARAVFQTPTRTTSESVEFLDMATARSNVRLGFIRTTCESAQLLRRCSPRNHEHLRDR
jgi:hypothetical protein